MISVLNSPAYANSRAAIATKTHGEGLPRTISVDSRAEKFRQQFKNEQGITSYEHLGLTFYRGNSQGLAIVKTTNRTEMAFVNIMKGTEEIKTWTNGQSFINRLAEYTDKYGCIPKFTSVSHGWRTEEDIGEIHGLSGAKGYNGIFSRDENRPTGFKRFGSRTLDEHLREAVEDGSVKFCDTCLAQFYACNVSVEFADYFAEISGCQTVLTTGQASPYFQDMDTPENRRLTLSAFHYWLGTPAIWAERGKSGWYRVTPLKDHRGDITKFVRENLGPLYIAL